MKKTLHILVLSHRGGVERTFLRYLKQMKEEDPEMLDNQVVLAIALNDYFKEGLLDIGVTVYGVEKKNSYDYAFIKQAQSIIKKHDIEVLYGQNFPGNFVSSLLGIWNKKLTVICHERGTSWNVNGLRSVMTKLWIKRASIIICNSHATKTLLKQRYKAPGHKLTVVYNGVPKGNYHGLEKKSHRLLYAGRLHPVKSPHTILYAMKHLKERVPQVHLDILGDGSLNKEIITLSSELGLEENVTFHGNVNNVSEYMSQASLLILPSIREPFGNVTIEAAYQMTPTIATNVDGIPEVIDDNKTGLLITPTEDVREDFTLKYVVDSRNDTLTRPKELNPMILTDEIEKLILDDQRRTRMGELAYYYVKEKFSIKRFYREIVEIQNDNYY